MDREDEIDPRYELRLGAGRPLPEAIADKLRDFVDNGVFKPGSRLPNESELARNMRVARSSVRTALQRLEAHGVLEVKRGVGWHVRRTAQAKHDGAAGLFDGKRYPVADLFEVRIGLDGLAASLAAVRASDGEIDDIAKLNTQHAEAGEHEDLDELLRTDIAFHEAIFRASRNDLLFENYQQVVGELTDWRYQSYAERGVPLQSAREHSKVVRFLRNHDPGGARAAMNGHLHRLYDGLPEIENEPLDSTYSGSDAEFEWRNRRDDL
jgi:GntR family transcriptional regulator, transcriptional repressor for pyruvate dehydrogenase complex